MQDKTLKLQAFVDTGKNDAARKDAAKPDDAKSDPAQSSRVEEKHTPQDLAKMAALLEDEKSKSFEHLKTIVQLRESLKQEKAKTAELEGRIKDLHEVLDKISGIAAAGKAGGDN